MLVNRMGDIDMDSRLNLEKVNLVFENCQYITIPAKYIRCLIMTDNYTRLSYSEWNHYNEFKNASVECLQIYSSWLKENHPMFNEDTVDQETNVYDRLENYSDITSIELFWIDDSNSEFTSTYYVPWDDEDEYENKYQQSKEFKLGDKEIVEISIMTDEQRKDLKND